MESKNKEHAIEPNNRRAQLISLSISTESYVEFREAAIEAAQQARSATMCFANVHMLVECERNHSLAQVVNQADWVAPGGMPLIWALRAWHGLRQDRVDGLDLLPDLLQRAADEQLPVYFYGSTSDVLAQTESACRKRFAGLCIVGTLSPPFRPLTPAEEDEVANQITASGARLVIVALGCPKQEQFVARMRGRIPAVLVAVGAALPVLAGAKSRAPGWMQKAGLEWLFRLFQEPQRLFKRYALTNSLFVYYLLRSQFQKQLQ